MIHFFRRIRKKLLSQTRFSKYLIYAIGEIFLVVIGILIALSINNRNDIIKEKWIEKGLLIQLKDDLKTGDLSDIQTNFRIHTQLGQSLNTIIQWLESDSPMNDSLGNHFSIINRVSRFLQTTSAYKTLEVEGIRFIKNDTLRNNLINYYERTTNHYLQLESEYHDLRWHMFKTLNSKHFKASIELDVTKDWDGTTMTPNNAQKLKVDEEYLFFLKTMKYKNETFLIGFIKNHELTILSLLDQIERELASKRFENNNALFK